MGVGRGCVAGPRGLFVRMDTYPTKLAGKNLALFRFANYFERRVQFPDFREMLLGTGRRGTGD